MKLVGNFEWSCGTCFYANRGTYIWTDANTAEQKETFRVTCRVNPPEANPLFETAMWPIVSDEDWCGRYRTQEGQ